MKISDEDFLKLAEYIKTHYGINLYEKKFLVESRLTNFILDCGFTSFSEYLTAVYNDKTGAEMANVINRLTTNYTYFMREQGHYKHFMEKFLPEVEKNLSEHELRIWSAGCSFGNEPYSTAMCMDNYFGERKYSWDRKMLATDISLNALRMAKRGVFSEQMVHNLSPEWIDKYFSRLENGTYQITKEIRDNVVFKYHNLIEPITFKKKFDLIICRNVMIYFDERTKFELIKRFFDATKPGGYIYIGHAESMPAGTGYKMEEPAIFRKPKDGERHD